MGEKRSCRGDRILLSLSFTVTARDLGFCVPTRVCAVPVLSVEGAGRVCVPDPLQYILKFARSIYM